MSEPLSNLLAHLYRLVRPIEGYLASPRSFELFLGGLGWDVTIDGSQMSAVEAAFGFVDLLDDLGPLVESVESSTGLDVDELEQLAQLISDIIQRAQALANTSPSGVPFPLDQPDFWQQLEDELFDRLIAQYLASHHPLVASGALLTGVISSKHVNPPGDNRHPYERTIVHWDRLSKGLTQPTSLMDERYHWSSDGAFDYETLLRTLEGIGFLNGVPAEYGLPTKGRALSYYTESELEAHPVYELRIPLLSTITYGPDSGRYEVGVAFLPIPASPGQDPTGVAIFPFLYGETETSILLSKGLSLELGGAVATDASTRLELFPGEVDLAHDAANIPFEASLALVYRADTDEPLYLLGAENSTFVRISGAELSTRLSGTPQDPHLTVEFGTGRGSDAPLLQGQVLLERGDSFIQSMLGTEPATFELGLTLVWSSKNGFSLNAQGGLQVTIPLNKQFGPAELISLTLGVETENGRIGLFAGLAANGKLGPLGVSIDQIGLGLSLTNAPQGDGLLGNRDLSIGFRPPKGLGISVDAGAVTGGGYLYFDPDRGEYAGAAQIQFGEIGVKAVGLLTTELPDGSDGFSLLVIISGEFPPIQLSFGFTLNAVGGLLGINRTVVVDVLREGIRTRTLDSIMFPEDPVRNAPQIISDLRRVFPPVRKQYVFGPMAIIGWGTPSILTMEIGVVLELPSPLRLVILGQLHALFPSAEVDPKIVEIHMDVLGIIDFDKKKASVDAVLYDSRIGPYALSGEMAMRMRWGRDPAFALAVGGMHPSFEPPSGFPKLERLAVSLGTGNNPRLRMETYQALTSNTVQFGSRVDLYASKAGFSIHGYLGFDALFQLSPFKFVVDIEAGVSLKKGSRTLMEVDLSFTLSGPQPWHATGEATFKVLMLSASVRFDVTVGSKDQPSIEAERVWPQLEKVLKDTRSWSAQLPKNGDPIVTLRKPPADATYVHPMGTLAVRQQVVPLDLIIETFGAADPGDETHFKISDVTFGGQSASDVTPTKEDFAPAQFFEMSDEEKLASPSFEKMQAGVRVGHAGLVGATSGALEKAYRIATVIIDEERTGDAAGTREEAATVPEESFRAAARFGAAAQSPLRRKGRRAFAGPEQRFTSSRTTHVIATTDTLEQVHPHGLGTRIDPIPELEMENATTYAGAKAALRAHLQRHPEDQDHLQIIAEHELAA
jgi:hypothetical protein